MGARTTKEIWLIHIRTQPQGEGVKGLPAVGQTLDRKGARNQRVPWGPRSWCTDAGSGWQATEYHSETCVCTVRCCRGRGRRQDTTAEG